MSDTPRELVPMDAAATAITWCEAVILKSFETMWRLTDDNLRLCEVQSWLHANSDHPDVAGELGDDLAHELAQTHSAHPLREYLEAARLRTNRERVPTWPREYWGLAGDRRNVGVGLEMVLLVDDRTTPATFETDVLLDPSTSRTYLVRASAEGCRMAGFDYQPPVPGWPPSSGVMEERDLDH